MFHVKHQIAYSFLSTEELKTMDALLIRNKLQLENYIDLLLWWNQKLNLISRNVSRETIMEHIRHSLLISCSHYFKLYSTIIDAGTGGGLPGIPLAICFPKKKFLLNDITEKKIIAVKNIVHKLKLKNTTMLCKGIQNIELSSEKMVITKHAFKVDELIQFFWKKNWETILFLKGSFEAEKEIKKCTQPLCAKIIHLDQALDSKFYEGKAIIEVKRKC